MNKTNINTTYNNNTTKPGLITKKIVNWSEYNRALVLRGDISYLVPGKAYNPSCIALPSSGDYALIRNVNYSPAPSGSVGHPKLYSDELILMMLAIRELFNLPLRQIVGFIAFLLGSISLIYLLPDYSTLSRRMQKLDVDFTRRFTSSSKEELTDAISQEGVTLLIDSSGFKIFGEGEWKVRKHGKEKRRTWVETHIGVNHQTRDITALTNTTAHVHDNTQVEPLLKQCKRRGVKVKILIGDGAYDAKDTYQLAKQYGASLITPPREGAVEHLNHGRNYQWYDTPGWEERNAVIRHIEEYGLDGWMADAEYHRRNLVENAFYRLKTVFSPKLKSRTQKNQYTEQCIRAKLLNHFNTLGLPKYAYRYPSRNKSKPPIAIN